MEILGLTSYQSFVFAGLVLAGFSAAYKFQFQALFFMLAIIHGGTWDVTKFTTFAIFHIAVCLFSGFLNGTLSRKRGD